MVTLQEGSKELATGVLQSPLGVKGVISPGQHHTCAVTAAGAAMCWGRNEQGQIGDGTTSDRDAPVPVDTLGSGVIAVASSYFHSCALTQDGAVKCWGYNFSGQVGDGSNMQRLRPVQVAGLTSGVVAITGGGYHTCALTNEGAVKCWGANAFGQLGNGNTDDHNAPVQVSGLTSGVTAIKSGTNHTCALTDEGAVSCWGRNTYGELGNNTTGNSPIPVPVSNMTSGVVSITGGFYHSCGVTGGGAARCWGQNDYGQLGDDSATDSPVPVPVTGLTTGVAAVSSGNYFSCALLTTGGVKCWGRSGGSNGSLGNGDTSSSPTPVQVTGLTSGVVSVDSNYDHSCAVTNTGAAKCWGDNFFGQTGDGNKPTDAIAPVDVVGFGDHATLVPAKLQIGTSELNAGTRTLVAHFGGDANNLASTSEGLAHTVTKGKSLVKTIKVKPRKPTVGKTARITIRLKAKKPSTGKPKGKLVLKDGRKKLGTFKVRRGKASVKTRFAKSGKHKLKAVYKGDKNWKKSTGKKTVKVK
ncbi:RCC1 domain-containing protein [Microbaculum marinisediminis]|uniref:Ig-like domain repeat protein n=1 Tax=Microbaculum marinisediminis TaxID=2931392 RepID=A0AAW5QZW4_9HYPH|nr:Ig-like domain repeat protein [Microbaculum sp. A6E488]MCT8973248.1 Ig-like domain repeat protein [Microbaculum sp. A6E488]